MDGGLEYPQDPLHVDHHQQIFQVQHHLHQESHHLHDAEAHHLNHHHVGDPHSHLDHQQHLDDGQLQHVQASHQPPPQVVVLQLQPVPQSLPPLPIPAADPYHCYKCMGGSNQDGLGRLLQCTGFQYIATVEQAVGEYNAGLLQGHPHKPLLLCKKGSNYRKTQYKCNFSTAPRFFHATCVGHDRAAAFANKITAEVKVNGREHKELVVMRDNLLKHLCGDCYCEYTAKPMPEQPSEKEAAFLEKRRAVKLASKRKCVSASQQQAAVASVGPSSSSQQQQQQAAAHPQASASSLPPPSAHDPHTAGLVLAQVEHVSGLGVIDFAADVGSMHLVKAVSEAKECEWCASKMEGSTLAGTHYICTRCNIHLCPDACFFNYHSNAAQIVVQMGAAQMGVSGGLVQQQPLVQHVSAGMVVPTGGQLG